jgi:hypothetical protein
MDPWSTHKWFRQTGRLLEIKGCWKKEYDCTACKRRFVEVVESGERFAAYASALDFEPLASEISERWLCEPCLGVQSGSDIAAYKNRPPSHAG